MPVQRHTNYGNQVLALLSDLAPYSPEPEKNGRAFAKNGVSEALFRKLRTGERGVSPRTHRIVVTELNRRLENVLRRSRGRPWRARFLDRLRTYSWLSVRSGQSSAKVRSRTLLAYAADRLSGTVSVEQGHLVVSISGRQAIRSFSSLDLARQVQPRQAAVAVHHLVAQLARSNNVAQALREVRKRVPLRQAPSQR